MVVDWEAIEKSTSPLEELPEGHYQRIFGVRTPEAIWRALLIEYRWVYHQMNGQLRETFAPFFLYGELRTLFICLRYLKELKRDKVREILSASLLSEEIKMTLRESSGELSAAQGLEEKFQCLSGRFRGITEIMRQEGLSGFEREVAGRYLSVIVLAGLDPVLRSFFTHIVDARNILALAKLLKLATTPEHPFIPGGTIDAKRLREILDRRNRQAADKILRAFTGEEMRPADLVKLEASLYRGISRSLKREGRASLGTGPVLDYLWRCSIEAMNLSLLSYGGQLKRDIVAAELVR